MRRYAVRRSLLLAPLWQHKGRLALSVLAIALGVALGYAVQLINQAAINEFAAAVQTLSGERLHGGGEFVDGRLVDELDGVAESDAERDGEDRQGEPALVLPERREQETAADRVAAHCAMLARVRPARRDQPRLGGLWLIRIQYIPSCVTAWAKAEKSIGLRT